MLIVSSWEAIVSEFNFSFKRGMIYKDCVPLPNKIQILHWIFAFSTVAIAVWSKTVFNRELKLTFVCFVESSLLGMRFSETWVLFSAFANIWKWMLFRTLITFNFTHTVLWNMSHLATNKSNASYLWICFSWYLCAWQFGNFVIYDFYYKINIKSAFSLDFLVPADKY